MAEGITDAMNSYEKAVGEIRKTNPKHPKKSQMRHESVNLIGIVTVIFAIAVIAVTIMGQ